jgi:hypothetical protein
MLLRKASFQLCIWKVRSKLRTEKRGKPMTDGKSEACFEKNQFFLMWCSFEHLLRSKVNGSLLPLLPESLNDANRCDSSCGESGASVLERPRGGPTLDGT